MSGIYVHIPFCKSKCSYCDFASFPKEIGKTESYFACLYRETEGRAKQFKDKKFSTIYFGGGTPSIVDSKFIAGEIRQIRKHFNLEKNLEITIEINPGTVTKEKIAEYKSVGINRFSIGLQTGFDDQLRRLNRIHTAKDFLLTCNLLKGENKSADILLGLVGQTAEQVKKTIDLCIAGEVNHISMYALTPEVGTPIYTDYLNGELLSDDEVADIYEQMVEYLKTKGFYRYEVSNFAKEGYESKHNLNYWQRGEYVGLGVSASSFMNGRRWTNTFKIDEYLNAIIFNKTPEISSDVIDEEDAMFEFVMLGLRTANGISKKEFSQRFNKDFDSQFKNALTSQAEFLINEEDKVSIKPQFLYVQNGIILEFMNK